jgi:DNA-binding MarR family transcriptional regulator
MGHQANRVARSAVTRTAPAPQAQDAAEADLDEAVDDVTAAVMDASRVFVAISARALADMDSGLTLVQLRTLVVLREGGPVKLATLAAALGVNPSTAMRTVDKLESVELVDRHVNPGNRREVVLSATAEGRHLVDQVMARRHVEIGALVRRLPDDQLASMVRALRALTEAADVGCTTGPGMP